MKIGVLKYEKIKWDQFSEDAHKIAFGTIKPVSQDRLDFALIVINEDQNVPMGYVTCRELDSDTVYWQFGGAMPGTKNTKNSWEAYKALVDWCELKYKRITTLIENDNLVMLKMAMKVGFRISGIRYYKGVLVEHILEFQK